MNQLRGLCVDSNTPEFVDAVAMGRAAGKFEVLEGTIAALSRAALDLHDDGRGYFGGAGSGQESGELDSPGVAAGELLVETLITAKPIDPSRLSFPGPPSFRPEKFFDARTAEIFQSPLDYAEDFEHYQQQVPKVKVNGSNNAKLDLFKMLAQSGRLTPVSSSRQRGPFVNGLFTAKMPSVTGSSSMLVRPTSWRKGEHIGVGQWPLELHWWIFACTTTSPSVFSGLDLRDYFYQFVISEQRTHRNILAGPISPGIFSVVPSTGLTKSSVLPLVHWLWEIFQLVNSPKLLISDFVFKVEFFVMLSWLACGFPCRGNR